MISKSLDSGVGLHAQPAVRQQVQTQAFPFSAPSRYLSYGSFGASESSTRERSHSHR